MPNIKFKSLSLRFLYLATLALGSAAYAQTVTGSFTGDGNSTQAVTGLGFQPDVLLIIPSTGGASNGEIQTWIHSSTMTAGEVKYTLGGDVIAEAFHTGFISTLDADGFTVALKSNASGTLYYYVGFSKNDGSVDVGTFTGATSDQNIITGYQPGMVWLWANDETTTDYMRWTVSGRATGTYRFSHGNGGWGETTFNGFSPIGFTVHGSSTGGSGIANGGTYHYVSFQGAVTEVNPGWGSGPDKVITPFEPGFLMTRHSTTSGNNTYIKTAEMPDGDSFIPRHEVAETNALLDFEVDGYTVGSAGQLRDKHWYFATEKISALPVELTKLQAREIDGNTYINWITSSEINNDYFEILASNDGQNWETISIVNGAGNSTTELNYAENIGEDTHRFYKLKQIDFDGTINLSNVIYLKREENASAQLMLFPNPAEEQLNIVSEDLEESDYTVKVIAINGAIVKSEKSLGFSTGNVVSVDLQGLSKGVYTVMITNELGFQKAQRFIKK